jgi:hypothetical protein
LKRILWLQLATTRGWLHGYLEIDASVAFWSVWRKSHIENLFYSHLNFSIIHVTLALQTYAASNRTASNLAAKSSMPWRPCVCINNTLLSDKYTKSSLVLNVFGTVGNSWCTCKLRKGRIPYGRIRHMGIKIRNTFRRLPATKWPPLSSCVGYCQNALDFFLLWYFWCSAGANWHRGEFACSWTDSVQPKSYAAANVLVITFNKH